MKNEISYEEALRKALDFPMRKIFWRYGYAYKGALEYEMTRVFLWNLSLKRKRKSI